MNEQVRKDERRDPARGAWACPGARGERIALSTSDGHALVAFAVHQPSPTALPISLSGTHDPSVTAFLGHAAW